MERVGWQGMLVANTVLHDESCTPLSGQSENKPRLLINLDLHSPLDRCSSTSCESVTGAEFDLAKCHLTDSVPGRCRDSGVRIRVDQRLGQTRCDNRCWDAKGLSIFRDVFSRGQQRAMNLVPSGFSAVGQQRPALGQRSLASCRMVLSREGIAVVAFWSA